MEAIAFVVVAVFAKINLFLKMTQVSISRNNCNARCSFVFEYLGTRIVYIH